MIFNNSMNTEGTGSKRKALEMITNIFCKKTKEGETQSINSEPIVTNGEDNCSNRNSCHNSLTVPLSEANIYSGYSDILPKSPISLRVQNIDKDMEALTLSRQDNPYIMQQLERLSVSNELHTELNVSTHSSPARSVQRISIATNDQHITSDGNFLMESDDSYSDNLHDKLIRSPPPNFPQKLSFFVFPDSSTASLQSYSLSKTGEDCDYSPSRAYLSPTFILSNHRLKEKRLISKSRKSDLSNDSILNDFKAIEITMHSPENQYLSARNAMKCERRGSDSSILSNHWKTSFNESSMTTSSTSLLSFVPRCSAINTSNTVCNDSNISCPECQFNDEDNDKSEFQIDSLQVMDMYCNYEEDSANQMNFMSPSNSREALLKDLSQVT